MKPKNNNISHDFYVKMLNKSTKKPYAVRFKWIRIITWLGSIFGNGLSIFFAFFFFTSLFASSFVNIDGITVKWGIVFFLSLFELLKRYVFDLFSLETFKDGKKMIRSGMMSFLVSTLVLIGFSFFFSMNGAQKFMNKEKEIQVAKQEVFNKETDSISNYYMTEYIKPLEEKNAETSEKIDRLTKQIRSWNAVEFNSMIQTLNENVKTNNERIMFYEQQRDERIEDFKEEYITQYTQQQDENKMNIIWFLLISGAIEILILSGVYYNRYYENATIKEYEKAVVNTPNYKKWIKCQNILEMLYETGIQMDEPISSTNEIIELVSINELNITKKEIENAFKVLGHLKIYQRIGNKRILKMNQEEAYEALRKHFKIK